MRETIQHEQESMKTLYQKQRTQQCGEEREKGIIYSYGRASNSVMNVYKREKVQTLGILGVAFSSFLFASAAV